MKDKKSIIPIILIIVMLLTLSIFITLSQKDRISKKLKEETKRVERKKEKPKSNNNSFDIKILKEINKQENYLISPYSIEIALNLLKNGAKGNTYNEIDNLVKDRTIEDVSINKRVSVANALFVTNRYKNKIEEEYLNLLTKKYSSDVLYDSFETPDIINKWVNEKTYNMIPKLLNQIDPDFAIGLANALAIDVEWYKSFDCIDTNNYSFNKNKDEKINVEMMSNEYKNNAEYFETDNSKGIIIPYAMYDINSGEIVNNEKGRQLEFIGILPNKDVYTYIDNLTEEELNSIDNNKIEATNKRNIKLKIPRFSYDYKIENFIDVLYNLGIIDAFDAEKADFTNIVSKENQYGNIYVGEAIHKTHIDLNEKGTKAAAVTYFGLYDNAMVEEKKEPIEITFDKPFIYIIRDKKSKEKLFIGTVYEPNIWKGSTCNEKENTN